MAIAGLPALAADVIFDVVQLVAGDLLALFGINSSPQWGLFLNGEPAVIADNVISFEFKQDRRISNYAVEEGAFESYNKVTVPFDVRLRFSSGGSAAKREELISSVADIMDSLETFDAVTPERVYTNINPVHQNVRRTAHNGAGLVIIDVYCQQIRVTATQQFANSQQATTSNSTTSSTTTDISVIPGSQINKPQSPSASPQVSDGTVQTTTAASGQFDLSQAMP